MKIMISWQFVTEATTIIDQCSRKQTDIYDAQNNTS